MCKQRNEEFLISVYLVSLQGKRLAWAQEVDQRINTSGLPLKRYVLTLTFLFVCLFVCLFFVFRERGVRQSFLFDFGLSVYQSY